MAYKRQISGLWYWYESRREGGSVLAVYLGPVGGKYMGEPPKDIVGSVVYPALREIVELNKGVVQDSGDMHALANKGNLEFTLDEMRLGRDIHKKAAVLFIRIIQGHPFVEGNKRTAFAAMISFLKANGLKFGIKHIYQATEIIIEASKGNADVAKMTKWVTNHCG